jgi:hypothetical protein
MSKMWTRLKSDEDADEEADVADAGHDEGLLGGGDGGGLLVPEADEEEGGEADELPEDEGLEEIDCIDEAEHGPAEEAEHGEEARLGGVLGHVTECIELDEEGDEGDDGAEPEAEAVEDERRSVSVAGAAVQPADSGAVVGEAPCRKRRSTVHGAARCS